MIAAATGVPLALQTALVAKGLPPRALRDDLAATLGAIGLADGAKLLLVGSTPAAQQALLEVEDKAHRRLAAQDKARVQMQRHVAGLPAAPASPFRFHRIAPLPHYAAPHRTTAEAHAYLAALAADPFLLAIMARRRWTVAVLSEFAPSLGWVVGGLFFLISLLSLSSTPRPSLVRLVVQRRALSVKAPRACWVSTATEARRSLYGSAPVRVVLGLVSPYIPIPTPCFCRRPRRL